MITGRPTMVVMGEVVRAFGHSVAMPVPAEHKLHQGSCTCGWVIHYDGSSFASANQAAHDHVADAYEAAVAARG